MAKVGLCYMKFGELKPDGTYDTPIQVGLAIKADVKYTKLEAKIDAENAEHDICNGVSGGTITLETEDITDATEAKLLGHKIDETTGEMVCNADDVAPEGGLSAITEKYNDGTYSYKATFWLRVKFSIPDETHETKESDSIKLNTSSIEGKLMLDDNRNYKISETFDTFAKAKAYIDGKFAGTTSTTE